MCLFPYSPPVESRNMRYGMLNEHAELIGTTKAFDGAILFLPKKITDTVHRLIMYIIVYYYYYYYYTILIVCIL